VKLFRRLRRRLAKELPTALPVRVYFRDLRDRAGNIHTTTHGWVILIRLAAYEREACETLVHEYAHALRDIPQPPADPHDDIYWIEHGRCYRIYEQLTGLV
jgi:hypothetical protein